MAESSLQPPSIGTPTNGVAPTQPFPGGQLDEEKKLELIKGMGSAKIDSIRKVSLPSLPFTVFR